MSSSARACRRISSSGLLLLAALLGQGCSHEETAAGGDAGIAACFEQSTGMQVARLDPRNHRVFAVPEQRLAERDMTQALSASSKCFEGTPWADDWTVSLFSSKEYAGYQDEPGIVPHHTQDAWANAYIGELDGATMEYRRFPALGGRDAAR